jgi:hypothetical protein
MFIFSYPNKILVSGKQMDLALDPLSICASTAFSLDSLYKSTFLGFKIFDCNTRWRMNVRL